jgi:iron(III) transport system substrate-binding protein
MATRARVIVYNTKHVRPEDVPQSIFDLADSRWRGKVAIANPQFGTTRTHAAALFAALGPQRAQQFFTDLRKNDVRIVDGNAAVKNLVARAVPNASPVYVGLTDTDDVLAGQAEGEPIAMIYPDQDDFGTLVIPSTVCLVAGAPHPEAGKRLVDYLLSAEVRAEMTAAGTGYSPLASAERDASAVRAMEVQPKDLLEQLGPSGRWTLENFQP